MIYTFNGYTFDTERLVLSHGDESINIRHNEAKLLAFLLLNAEHVVSKDQILSQVWRDKVVSEQAIFQNISHLRAIFGNDSIKTYPKRGYQWKLASQPQAKAPSAVQPQPDIPKAEKTTLRFIPLGLVASLFLAAITMGIYSLITPKHIDTGDTFSIAVLKDEHQLVNRETVEGDADIISHLSPDAFFQSPEWEFSRLSSHFDIILGGQLRQLADNYYYEFLLKGQAAEWRGVYSAPTLEQLRHGLHQHLNLEGIQEIVASVMLPDIKLAKLSVAHAENPQDLILLSQLIEAYITINQLDNALLMAEKLQKIASGTAQSQANNDYHLGVSLLQQSRILNRKGLYPSSEDAMVKAMFYFEKIGDYKRLSDAWYEHSIHKLVANDYDGIKTSLLKASALAAKANDPIREIESLTYLSVLAHKKSQFDDQYHYLLIAEEKMKAYKLADYQFAKIPFHYSMFASDDADKVPHWKKVLAYCQVNPDFWVAQVSRERLLTHYLNHGRINDAKGLLEGLRTDNAQNSYLRTRIALAEGQQAEFIRLAQATFEKGQLAGLYDLSADVAVLLLSNVDDLSNREFYLQFIEQNTSEHWRRRNQEQLMAWSL